MNWHIKMEAVKYIKEAYFKKQESILKISKQLQLSIEKVKSIIKEIEEHEKHSIG